MAITWYISPKLILIFTILIPKCVPLVFPIRCEYDKALYFENQ